MTGVIAVIPRGRQNRSVDGTQHRVGASVARGLGAVMLCLLAITVPTVGAQTPAPSTPAPPPIPTWRLSAINTVRAESWRFFEPRPGGGDPDYAYLGDRLRVDVRGHWAKVELTLAAQHVGMIGLPDGALGPGALGPGALYFDQGGRRSNSSQVYLRSANLRFPAVVWGVDLQGGPHGLHLGRGGAERRAEDRDHEAPASRIVNVIY